MDNKTVTDNGVSRVPADPWLRSFKIRFVFLWPGLFSVVTMIGDQIGSALYSATLELVRSDRPPVSNFNYEEAPGIGQSFAERPS
jgi:hypothetical protein